MTIKTKTDYIHKDLKFLIHNIFSFHFQDAKPYLDPSQEFHVPSPFTSTTNGSKDAPLFQAMAQVYQNLFVIQIYVCLNF